MNISENTLSAIKIRLMPPYCASLDMAQIIIKRFLQRTSFSLNELNTLTEEDAQRLLVFLESIFIENLQESAVKQTVKEIAESE